MGFEKIVYSVSEAAEVADISPDKMYELVRAGDVPHKRIGRQIRIPVEAFRQWLMQTSNWSSSRG